MKEKEKNKRECQHFGKKNRDPWDNTHKEINTKDVQSQGKMADPKLYLSF